MEDIWDVLEEMGGEIWDWANANPDVIAGLAGAYDAYEGGDDTAVKPWYLPGQQEGLETAIGAAVGQFNNGPDSYYPGQTVADLDPNLTSGWDSQLSSMDQQMQMGEASAQAALNLASGGDKVGGFQLEDQIGFGLDPMYEDAIMSPIMRELNEQIIPGIHTDATAQGAFGGSRMTQQKADAATQATEAATDAMIMGNLDAREQSIGQRAGDISAQLTGRDQDITQNKNIAQNMYNSVGATRDAQGNLITPGQNQAHIGALQTEYAQDLINADKDRFDWNREENNNYVDRLINRLNGTTPAGGTVTPGASGGLTAGLTGYFSGANAYNTAYGNPPPANPK